MHPAAAESAFKHRGKTARRDDPRVPGPLHREQRFVAGDEEIGACRDCHRQQVIVARVRRSARAPQALDPRNLSAYPSADLAVRGIGDLLDYEFHASFVPGEADDGRSRVRVES